MTRTTLILSVCLALAVSSASFAPQEAMAKVRKDVGEFAGVRCNIPKRDGGIIVGHFSGVDDSPFVGGGEFPVNVSRIRCFQTMDECQGWLYTMQSLYTNAGTPTIVRCTRR